MKALYLFSVLFLSINSFANNSAHDLKELNYFLKNIFKNGVYEYMSDIEEIIDEAELEHYSFDDFSKDITFSIHSSCKIRNDKNERVLDLDAKIPKDYLKLQAIELLKFIAKLRIDMNGQLSSNFHIKKVYLCSKEFPNETLRLQSSTNSLHFNPKTHWRAISNKFLNVSEPSVLSAFNLREYWDEAKIFPQDTAIEFKILWKSFLNPALMLNIQLRKNISWAINSLLKYKKHELSKREINFLQTRAMEEVLNAKVSAIVRKIKKTRIRYLQLGLVNHSNFHDIDVLVNFNSIASDVFSEDYSEVDTENFDIDNWHIQIGTVNTYSVDLVRVNLNVSVNQVLDITKKIISSEL